MNEVLEYIALTTMAAGAILFAMTPTFWSFIRTISNIIFG